MKFMEIKSEKIKKLQKYLNLLSVFYSLILSKQKKDTILRNNILLLNLNANNA